MSITAQFARPDLNHDRKLMPQDFLKQALALAQDPAAATTALCEELRRLSDARLVIVAIQVDHDDGTVLTIQPPQLGQTLPPGMLEAFHNHMQRFAQPHFWHVHQQPTADDIIRFGATNCLSMPLMAGDLSLGVVLLFDCGNSNDIQILQETLRIPCGILALIWHQKGNPTPTQSPLGNISTLKTSEKNLELATSIGEIGIWEWNIADNVLTWDETMCRLYGVKPTDFSGSPQAWAQLLHPEDRSHVESEIQAVLHHKGQYRREFRIVRPDGSLRHIQSVARLFSDDTGTPLRMLGSDIDLSERNHATELLKQHIYHLEDEARQHTEQLLQTQNAAQAANIAKSAFLANMSHEFRTPMNAITGMCYLIQRTHLDQRQKRYFQTIETATRTLLGLLSDVLDLSKIEAGKFRIENATFTLREIIDNIIHIQSLRADEKALEFNLFISHDLPSRFQGDALRLEQVCNKLLSNAIKFTERGEIILRIGKFAQTLDRTGLRFEVRDTGIGIAPEVMTRLLAPFEQGEASMTRHYGGTGLSLNICKRLIEAMGGEIGVDSVPGQGSNFWFQVWLTHLKESEPPTTPETSVLQRRVLVVDDSATTRAVVQEILQTMHYRVDTCASGSAALVAFQQAIRQNQLYDLAVIDWSMPGINGVETLQQLRTNFSPELPVILMANSHGCEEALASSEQIGIEHLLLKPVTANALQQAIETLFNPEHQTARKPSITPPAATLAGRRILIADDSAINREILGAMLKSFDIKYGETSDGAAAVEQMQQCRYDLALLDVEMPIMDGVEATRRLRGDPRFDQVPIVLMTVHDLRNTQDNFRQVGANDVLIKPLEATTLFAMLEKWLNPDANAAATPRFDDKRALVVEDVAANRDVLRELLEDTGIVVSDAENGQQAWELIQSQAFDIVLMDIQMPVMDGLEATRLIRADGRFSTLPIIAVTAHALSGDEEKCLTAGMDDYVSKPIIAKLFYQTLAKFLPARLTMPPTPGTADAGTDQDIPLPSDEQCLQIDWALAHVMGNRKLLRKLLIRFLQEHSLDHHLMQQAFQQGNRLELSHKAHALAGVAGGIGARELFEQCKTLETLAHQDNHQACAMALDRLIAAHQTVMTTLTRFQENWVPETTNSVRIELPPDRMGSLLAALIYRLNSGCLDAQNYLTLLEATTEAQEHDNHLQLAIRMMKSFDFDGAQHQLRLFAAKQLIELPDAQILFKEEQLQAIENQLQEGRFEQAVSLLENLHGFMHDQALD